VGKNSHSHLFTTAANDVLEAGWWALLPLLMQKTAANVQLLFGTAKYSFLK